MKNKRNYYRILHVQPDAPKEIIQSSYRTLMQKLKAHPDLGGEDWNATIINEAYGVLMDTDKRRDYDAMLFRVENQENLSKQHENLRQDATDAEEDDDWKPFQAIVLDQ